ncbi:MAG TPA: thioredoxin-dependent thiol peroxidase [Candidatus Atribacteria bacterium]|nr:thioredoxin-dependent thiol peroxidase [Candidatus Atribacteria bacterium]
MELKIGMKAPDFTLPDSQGNDVSLSNFIGKNVILYFYPKDNSGGCTAEAIDFRDNYEKIEKTNTVVIGISKDSAKSHLNFAHKYNLPFILLSDKEGKVCELYGVWKEKKLYGRTYMGIERTTFLINQQGFIMKIFPRVKVKGHVEEIVEDLYSLLS